ncbi:unnamed protein product [Gongylonema pulchrum]|uniref:DNA-directed RNA polymerase n=1 Tax=Gongylonema pulchrum TaxID=637853 RepID=A0A183ESR1_9BILA|nr:unnamed protein product [Gongylonema pulchrum]
MKMSLQPVIRLLYNSGVEDVQYLHFSAIHSPEYHIVFLNGGLIGLTVDPQRIVSTIRAVRRHGLLNEFVSVSTNAAQRAVYIASDGGRLCRPYIIVTKGRPHVTQAHIEELKKGHRIFEDFVDDGLIEYLDVNEMNDASIAVYEHQIKAHTTHLENC